DRIGACRPPERADHFQNRCSSNRKAARQILRQTVPPISGAKTQRALLYVRPKNPNIDKECPLLQSRSLLQADRPSLIVQTILDEGATHCPDPITGSRPLSEARAPNRCLRDCNLQPNRTRQNSSSCSCFHSSLKSQQPPHCRGRCNSKS